MPASKSTVNVNTMPADKKITKKTETVAPAAEPAPSTPAKGRKAAKAEVTVPTVVESTPVAEAPAPVRSAAELLAALPETLRALQSELQTRVRAAIAEAQEAARALKRDAREGKRRRKVDPSEMTPEQKAAWEARRANNAFLKPRSISDELATFMGLPAKSQRSQTEVTKFVSQYVKSHNCFDPNFKRRIIPDAKLAKLLRVKDGQEVTYLNLQGFLKVHFLKPSA
jgi:chromatin remodeling complex protein RSC6